MMFLIVGDSHTQYFGISHQLRGMTHALRGIRSVNKVVSASTVAGVGKVDSTLQLGANIHRWVDEVDPDYLVLNLGQVDVELGIPYRQFVTNRPEGPEYWLNHFIEEYFNFLDTLTLDPSRIIIKGINLPVLCYDHAKAIKYISRIVTERFTDDANDEKQKQVVLEKLNKRYSSDSIRTDLATRFNQKLQTACDDKSYGYFDINDELRSTKTDFINPRFIPSKFDHHIIDSLEVRIIHWEALIKVARENYWRLENAQATE